jgi:Tfp pilus assembly protein PilO
MKALFSFSAEVPFSRVIAEHRRWLAPVGILLAINIVVLLVVVLPLRQSVRSGATRADASAPALRAAMADLADAEATRDGQARAAADLDRFYAEVLPSDFMTARRITHIKLAQLARSHDVEFQRGAATPEIQADSTLERLHVSNSLTGDWDDIRQMIYDIETGPDFVVIDNVQLAESSANAALTLTLDLSTYYRVAGAPGASGARSPNDR